MGSGTKFALCGAAAAVAAALFWNATADDPQLARSRTADRTPHTAESGANAAAPQANAERIAVSEDGSVDPLLVHPFAYELEIAVQDADGLPVFGAAIQLAPSGCALNRSPVLTDDAGIARLSWRGRRQAMVVALAIDNGATPAMLRLLAASGVPQRVAVGGYRNHGTFRISMWLDTTANATSELSIGNTRERLHGDSWLRGGDQGRIGAGLELRAAMHPHAVFADVLLPAEAAGAAGEARNRLAGLDTGLLLNRSWLSLSGVRTVSDFTPAPGEGASEPTVLEGVVYGEDGAPVPQCTVIWGTEVDRPAGTAQTDENGAFRFEGVHAGALEVRAGGRDAGLHRQRVSVLAGKTTHVEARLQRESTVRGKALAADGRPLAGYRVEFVGLGKPWFDVCTTAEDGAFVLPNLPGGTGQLLLWHPNHDERRDVAGGEETVRRSERKLPLAVLASVLPDSGEVLLQLPADGVRGALQVELLPPENASHAIAEVRVWQEETGRGALCAKADGSNVFRLENLPAGQYRVEVGCTTLGWIELGPYWVDGKGTTDAGRVSLPQYGDVEIHNPARPPKSQEADGAAAFAQEIYRRNAGCDVRAEHVATDSGAAMRLPPGHYFVLWRDATGGTGAVPFEVRPGVKVKVDCTPKAPKAK